MRIPKKISAMLVKKIPLNVLILVKILKILVKIITGLQKEYSLVTAIQTWIKGGFALNGLLLKNGFVCLSVRLPRCSINRYRQKKTDTRLLLLLL